MNTELHAIQIQILNKLLFKPSQRYVDLRPSEDIENNKLNFHLKQLQELGLIQKIDDVYSLTAKGKEFAGRIDTDKLKVHKQAKISVSVCCIREDSKGQREYLIYTRLKQPFYGCQGFLTGKVGYAEQVKTAAARELTEETGLSGEPQITALKHYRVFDHESHELLEDKQLFFCVVHNPMGDLQQSEEGKFEWVKRKDLKKYVTNHFESYPAFRGQLKLVEGGGEFKFIEEDHYSKKF